MRSPRISVIICTHNPNRATLSRVIDALRNQTLPTELWQLRIVDNASRPIVRGSLDLSWHPDAQQLDEPRLGLVHARKCGIRNSDADLFIFVDDDNLLAKDYLEQALTISEKYPWLGIWNGSVAGELESKPGRVATHLVGWLGISEVNKAAWSNETKVCASLPFGVGLCVRRKVAEYYAELCERDSRRHSLGRIGASLSSCEDWDMAFTASDLGLGMGRFPQLKATHVIASFRSDLRYIFRIISAIETSSQMLFWLRNGVTPTRPKVTSLAMNVLRLARPRFGWSKISSLVALIAKFSGERRAYRQARATAKASTAAWDWKGSERKATPIAQKQFFHQEPLAERSVAAIDLLTPFRFDIAIKVIFAKAFSKAQASDWAKLVYLKHLEIWNQFFESEPRKESPEDFVEGFRSLYDSLKGGYKVTEAAIPLTKDFSPTNGAHRIAASIVLGQNVRVRVTNEDLRDHNYSFYYFRDLARANGIEFPAEMLDAAALEYVRLKENCHLAVLFPRGKGQDDAVRRILSAHGDLVFERQVTLNGQGPLNLIRLLYGGEWWLGEAKDGYAGAQSKARDCFSLPGKVRLFLFEASSLQEVTQAKEKIRQLFLQGKHSIHITDSVEEVRRVCATLLNSNGTHFLQHRNLNVMSRFDTFLSDLKASIRTSGIESSDFCVGGSAVLAAYGLRDCNDFDLVHLNSVKMDTLPSSCSSHNDYCNFYGAGPAELVEDPRNYFVHEGIKFLSLARVLRLKKTRHEKKDKVDVKLIKKAA